MSDAVFDSPGGDLLDPDEDAARTALDRLMDEVGSDDTWALLEEMHASLDRLLDAGEIDGGRARELRERLLELSRRVVSRAVTDEANAYQRLLRDVSHDIRSPLHSILFLAEALYSDGSQELGRARKRQLGTIYAAGTSLLNLVNDVLDYARMEAGEVSEVAELAFSLSSVLSDVRRLLGPLVQHYDTVFVVRSESDGRHVGDPQLLCRVLTNLVSNGVKAAGRGGTVAVQVRPLEDGVRVEVFDDGSDVDIEKLRALTAIEESEDPLAVASREKLSGRTHGLGLIICGRLVRATGGRIEVDRGPLELDGEIALPEGTRFTVTLPFVAEKGSGGDATRCPAAS